MKKSIIEIFLLALYTAITLMAVKNISPVYAPWLSTIMSIALILAYYLLALKTYIIPLLAILFVTVFFPLGILVSIGVSTYGSWGASANSLLHSMAEHFVGWVPQFVPFIASLFLVLLLTRTAKKTTDV